MENLALNEARILKMRYPDEKPESEKTYGTATTQITSLRKHSRPTPNT
jgi:hypothetical protein